MSTPAEQRSAGLELDILDPIAEAIESGAGLFEVVRAAARALDASLALLDRSGTPLALTPPPGSADERALLNDGQGVTSVELRVADAVVGELRLRPRSEAGPALLKLVATLVATDPIAPAEEGWRRRLLAVAESAVRAVAPGAVGMLADRADAAGAEAVILLPGGDDDLARRAADSVLRGLQSGLGGFSFALGRSRVAADPLELPRAADEALLAANVAETTPDRPALAFDETGAYRLLLSAMSEDPAELQRFYSETVEPLVAYDEQYETSQLVRTLETFLDADGNVAGTAQRLFTHRHTIRYRLERVRELSGLDVGSSDGREKLSLGLKAMRVLGIAAPGGPATEAGAGGGRVPRASQTR